MREREGGEREGERKKERERERERESIVDHVLRASENLLYRPQNSCKSERKEKKTNKK